MKKVPTEESNLLNSSIFALNVNSGAPGNKPMPSQNLSPNITVKR